MNLATLRTLVMEHAKTHGVRPDSVTLSRDDAREVRRRVLAECLYPPMSGDVVTFMGVRIEESASVTTPVLS